MVALLQRLRVEVRRELGQGLVVEPDGDGDVLLGGRELVGDLVGEQGGELRGLHAAHRLTRQATPQASRSTSTPTPIAVDSAPR